MTGIKFTEASRRMFWDKTHADLTKHNMPHGIEVLVGLQYRDRLSVGQSRIDLGYHAYHWSVLVFDGQYHRFDITDGIVQDPITFEDVNPNRVWMHRHLTSKTLLEIPRYLGSVRIGGGHGAASIEQIATVISKFRASELGGRDSGDLNCFTWTCGVICILRDSEHLPNLNIVELQDFALDHADKRLADFNNVADPIEYRRRKRPHLPSCIVV